MNYVDLQKNPERYTGYSGHLANRIWKAIYSENCFIDDINEIENPLYFNKKCIEKRVFYRLISGLHTSITTHLAYDFLLDEENDIWGKNYDIFNQSVASHPSRIKNLYFTYLFMLRALSKIMDPMISYEYKTKNKDEALMIKVCFYKILYSLSIFLPLSLSIYIYIYIYHINLFTFYFIN